MKLIVILTLATVLTPLTFAQGGIVYASTFPGADPCEKEQNAETALSVVGGIVDATGFYGVLPECHGGMTIGASGPVMLLLGTATWTVNGQVVIAGTASQIQGRRSSMIKQGSSFPASTPIVQIAPTGSGNGSSGLTGATVENVEIDCNYAANSIGAKNVNGQELSGFFSVVVARCTQYGIWYEGVGVQNSSGRGLVIASAGTSPNYIGLYIHNASNAFRGVSDATPCCQRCHIDYRLWNGD